MEGLTIVWEDLGDPDDLSVGALVVTVVHRLAANTDVDDLECCLLNAVDDVIGPMVEDSEGGVGENLATFQYHAAQSPRPDLSKIKQWAAQIAPTMTMVTSWDTKDAVGGSWSPVVHE